MYLRLNDQISNKNLQYQEQWNFTDFEDQESRKRHHNTRHETTKYNSLTKFSHLFNCLSDQLFILINSEDWEKSESCLFLFCYWYGIPFARSVNEINDFPRRWHNKCRFFSLYRGWFLEFLHSFQCYVCKSRLPYQNQTTHQDVNLCLENLFHSFHSKLYPLYLI